MQLLPSWAPVTMPQQAAPASSAGRAPQAAATPQPAVAYGLPAALELATGPTNLTAPSPAIAATNVTSAAAGQPQAFGGSPFTADGAASLGTLTDEAVPNDFLPTPFAAAAAMAPAFAEPMAALAGRGGVLGMTPSADSDTLPFTDEIAAVAAQLTVRLSCEFVTPPCLAQQAHC